MNKKMLNMTTKTQLQVYKLLNLKPNYTTKTKLLLDSPLKGSILNNKIIPITL